jgi:hypothetical protein
MAIWIAAGLALLVLTALALCRAAGENNQEGPDFLAGDDDEP